MAAVETRPLGEADKPVLLAFLTQRPDTTMFLRQNAQRAGLTDYGERFQGTWAAAFLDGKIVAAAAHFWKGNVVFDCPTQLVGVVRTAVKASPRELLGLEAPWGQIQQAKEALGLLERTTYTNSREILYALQLDALRVPRELEEGVVVCRRGRADEVSQKLAPWRSTFDVETTGATPTTERHLQHEEKVRLGQIESRIWVLEYEDRGVASSTFNARGSDCVQIGGVFTPPEYRGRGLARSVVAGSLCRARREGVSRSVLFTGETNVVAQACYHSLGYERGGDYGMVFYDPA